MSKNVIYNAIVLDEVSTRRLKIMFPSIHPAVYYHHVTINHGKNEFPDNIGDVVEFNVIGYAEDDNGQAVVVDAPSENKIPHITLSCNFGVKPVYSNTLLKSGYNKVAPFKLKGTVKSFTKHGWIG